MILTIERDFYIFFMLIIILNLFQRTSSVRRKDCQLVYSVGNN